MGTVQKVRSSHGVSTCLTSVCKNFAYEGSSVCGYDPWDVCGAGFECARVRAESRCAVYRACSEKPRHMFDRIECGRFTFDVGIGGDDDLRDLSMISDSLEEGRVVQFIRQRSSNRRYDSSEHVILSAIDPSALDREHIEIVFDDAEERRIPSCIHTNHTLRE